MYLFGRPLAGFVLGMVSDVIHALHVLFIDATVTGLVHLIERHVNHREARL